MILLWFLLLGGILTIFNIDTHLVKATKEWTGKELSVSSYWAFWFVLGIFFTIVDLISNIIGL